MRDRGTATFGDVEAAGDDLAVARDVANGWVDTVDGEEFTDFAEEVLAETGDGALGLGVMAQGQEVRVVERVVLQVRKFAFAFCGPAPRAGLVSRPLREASAATAWGSVVPPPLTLEANLLPAPVAPRGLRRRASASLAQT